MTVTILHEPTRAACALATSQQTRLQALLEPFGAGPITARLESPSGTHLRTLTIPLPEIEATSPRRFTLGVHLADAAVATGAPGRWVLRTPGGLSICSLPAGTSGSSINHVGDVKTLCTPTLAGVVVSAPDSLPVSPHPLSETLALIRAARAAGDIWVKVSRDTHPFSASWPPEDLRDINAIGSTPAQMIYVWPAAAAQPSGRIWLGPATGHANGSYAGLHYYDHADRQWHLGFHGPEMVRVQSGTNIYRPKDFNASPQAPHPYSNEGWLRILNQKLTMGGAAWNDGGPFRIWDEGITGDQPGLRIACAFTLDVTLAGQGYVAGATGSNAARGAYAGTVLPGANAWQVRDWLHPDHPSKPIFGGTTYATHIDRGLVTTVETVGGVPVDVAYYTAGSAFGLLRSEIRANQLNDVTEFVCSGLDMSGDGEVFSGGNIAMDEERRLIVLLARGNGGRALFRFVDLKRPAGTRTLRSPVSVGGDEAAFRAESKGEPGLVHVPADGRFVAFCWGSASLPGSSPGVVWEIVPPPEDDPGTGFTPDTGWTIVARTSPPGRPVPPGPYPYEVFPAVCRRFFQDPAVDCTGFLTNGAMGEVHLLIPRNWRDPEA